MLNGRNFSSGNLQGGNPDGWKDVPESNGVCLRRVPAVGVGGRRGNVCVTYKRPRMNDDRKFVYISKNYANWQAACFSRSVKRALERSLSLSCLGQRLFVSIKTDFS